MANEVKPEKLTLWEALKDLGWFPLLFAIVVGGPSILAILEEVFVNHQLVPALQWIVDGYNRIMAVLGAVVEPLVQPAIDWVNRVFGWRLVLDPVWRPVFSMFMVLFVSGARDAIRRGELSRVLWFGLPMGVAPSLLISLGLGLSVRSGANAAPLLAFPTFLVVYFGSGSVLLGFHTGQLSKVRLGLTILGGFVAAGLILAADFGLKALGVG